MIEKIVAIILMIVFYAAYLGKKYTQRRQGITTNQIGKGESKPQNVLRTEAVMGIATVAVIPVEVASIIIFPRLTMIPVLQNCLPMQWMGLTIAAIGVAFFIIAMLTMADSWRAGIPENDKTAFVQKGIYSISRNPAFVGFDLLYLGLLVAFPNIVHFIFALFPMVMLHLQIKHEEVFCLQTFGPEYESYTKRVRRYL